MAPAACVVAAAAASSLLLAAALAAASSGSSGHAVQYVLANTTWGAVRGQVANGTQVWKGVRYAAPASGALRWAAPQPPAPWTGVADALDFAPGCLQNSHNRDTPAEESEDCLFVNVWSPLEAPGPQGWPVMVFIHGGGYFEGAGSLPLYDGSYLCNSSNTVVVTLNYRLGAFGFLVTDTLTGNYGLEDQRAALQWVRDNVAAFGGAPDQVTVFGESAGAMSVGLHLISPASRGLFRAAMMESNPVAWQYKEPARAAEQGAKLASLLGCASGDLTCLRAASGEAVLEAQVKAIAPVWIKENWGHLIDGFLPWTPVLDAENVPQQVLAAIAAGAAVDVPVVLGTNHDEGVSFVAANLEALSGAEAKAAVIAMFGLLNAPKIIPLYNFTDGRMALSQVITDYLFRCPTRRAAQLLSGGAREAATFLYEYAHVLSFNPTDSPVCANVTCHAAELPMVFHAVREGAHTMTPPEQALAATFGELWTSFARQGTPSSDATGAWPAFSEAAGQPQLLLQTPQPAVESAADDSVCAVWDAVGYTH